MFGVCMIKLSKRLETAAKMVRYDCSLADIGCDHGYVPVYLIQQGIIKNAIASDINEKPLSSCRALVKENGLEDKIKCVLSNGLENINLDEIDDILIAGMGGELIADILSNCDMNKLKEKHLILNPMTHPEIARKFLYENGFAIVNDTVVKDGRHYYCIMDSVYTGAVKKYDSLDFYFGNIKINDDNKGYFLHLLNYLKNKQKSGENHSEVISAIEEKTNDNG